MLNDLSGSEADGWEFLTPAQRVRKHTEHLAGEMFYGETTGALSRSLYVRLLQSFGHEITQETALETRGEAEDAFQAIHEFVLCLFFAVGRGFLEGERNPDFWRHQLDALNLIRSDKAPDIARDSVEESADMYLRLPARSEFADRTLVDILIATELFSYGKETFGKYGHVLAKGRGPLAFLAYRGCSFAIAAVVISAVLLLRWLGLLSEGWTTGLVVGVIGLFLLESAIALLGLPFAWNAQVQHNRRAIELWKQMNSVYSELSGNGPFSVRHIRDRAQAASSVGVVWPGPLFALLDDIQTRGERF